MRPLLKKKIIDQTSKIFFPFGLGQASIKYYMFILIVQSILTQHNSYRCIEYNIYSHYLYSYLARANHKMIIEMYKISLVPSTRKHNINQTKQSLINKWFIPCWDSSGVWWLLTSQFRSCLFWCHLLSDSRASYFPLFLFPFGWISRVS